MRSSTLQGWRTARWRAGDATAVLGEPPAPGAPPQDGRRRGGGAPVPVDATASDEPMWPWQGVEWSLSFVGLLVYTFVVISYELAIGQEAMIVALVGLAFDHRARVRIPAAAWLFLGFILIGTVSYTISPYKTFSTQAIEAYFKYLVIMVVAVSVVTTRARVRFYAIWYLGCFALYPVRGAIFNFFVYGATEQGRVAWNFIFSNPNDLSATLLFPLGLALGVAVRERNPWLRRAAMVGVVLIPLCVFLSQSRGSILALGVAALAVLLTMQRGRGRVVLGLAAVSLVLVIFAPKSVWERMANLGSAAESGNLKEAGDSNSARQRWEIMRIGMVVAQDNLALGVGLASNNNAHAIYAKTLPFREIGGGARDAHNTYITVAAETGVFGFLMFMGMFVVSWLRLASARRAIRHAHPQRARELFFLQMGFLAFTLSAIFGTYTDFVFTYLTMALIYVMAEDALRDPSASFTGARPRAG